MPNVIIHRSVPCLEMVFNLPLTEEEKEKFREELRKRYGDGFEVEIRDEGG